MTGNKTSSPWWVYILECNDGSYYSGSAKDLQKRVQKHNAGKGAKYTRNHIPVKLVYFEPHSSRSLACKKESQIKKLSREEKVKMVRGFSPYQLPS